MVAMALILGGCVSDSTSTYGTWYERQDLRQPTGSKIYVCHAFGCLMTSPITFSTEEAAAIAAPFDPPPIDAGAERLAISRAVQEFERIVGGKLGTHADLGGFEKIGGGDPTQMDCIDEAANSTSLLVYLVQNGLIQYHTVRHPVSRGILIDGRYPHNTAVLKETTTGTSWAIDSWPRANAEPPDVMRLDVWVRQRRSS